MWHIVEIVCLNNTIEKPGPEKSDTVLLLVDVINDFDFEDADKLLRFALPVAEQIAALKKRAVAQRYPDYLRQRQFWSLAFKPERAGRALQAK